MKYLAIFALFALGSADFQCPTSPITMAAGNTGVIPAGATSMISVANGTMCDFTFQIDAGFALKLTTSADYEAHNGEDLQLGLEISIPPGTKDQVEYVVDSSLKVSIVTRTDNFKFIISYSYIDLSQVKQKALPTGTNFNAQLDTNTYYTIMANDENHVAVNLGVRNTPMIVNELGSHQVFVFDGDNLKSGYLGRLVHQNGANFQSSGQNLTFLNLYGAASDTYIQTNDKEMILNTPYDILVPSRGKVFSQKLGSVTSTRKYTIICDGCTNFFITKLEGMTPDSIIQFAGMSPTNDKRILITYHYNDTSTNMVLPQHFPAQTVTMTVYNATVTMEIQTDIETVYQQVVPGRWGELYAPKMWDDNSDQSFDWTFTSGNNILNYEIVFYKIDIASPNHVAVEIGQTGSTPVFDKIYTGIVTKELNSGDGDHMILKFQGADNDFVAARFHIREGTGQTSAPLTSTVTPKVVTTTTITKSVETTPTTVGVTTPTTMKDIPSTTTSPKFASTSTKLASTVTSTTIISTTTDGVAGVSVFLSFVLAILLI